MTLPAALHDYADGDDIHDSTDDAGGGGINEWTGAINDLIELLGGAGNALALIGATIKGYTEAVTTISASGTSQTLDISEASIIDLTLTGNCTCTMPTAANGKSFEVRVRSGTGGYTCTFTGVKWPAGTAPTFTATASRMDRAAFESDGSVWYGSVIQNYTP